MTSKNSLGCGKGFKVFNNHEVRTDKNPDFICGVANAWGYERLCLNCKIKLKEKWKKEDLRKMKGGIKE